MLNVFNKKDYVWYTKNKRYKDANINIYIKYNIYENKLLLVNIKLNNENNIFINVFRVKNKNTEFCKRWYCNIKRVIDIIIELGKKVNMKI